MRYRLTMCLLIAVLLIMSAYGLSISGQSMKILIDHVPGYTREDIYYITNNEGYTSSYTINPTNEKGEVPAGSFVVTPERMENVQNGETRAFKVKVILPDNIDTVGQNEVWVQARLDSSSTGVIRAVPSIAIRYIIYVLYPYKYVRTEFNAPSMNVNETKEFVVVITNLGKPLIENAYAKIDIFNLETGDLIDEIQTQPVYNLASRETALLKADFDSTGLKPGNFKAVAEIKWDDNTTSMEQEFRIGTKHVKIIDFPKLFEYDAINKMDITVESAWNTKIENLQAEITIIDPETRKSVKSFKSFATALEPWERKSIESYFETKGLEKKEYTAQIVLSYEGSQSSAEDKIRIDENINAVVVQEIPGTFSFSMLSAKITPINILILLIAVFILINLFLVYSVLKKKSKKDVLVDEEVLKKVITLISQYKDEYIKEMMIKKGWGEEEVRIILEEAKKRTKR